MENPNLVELTDQFYKIQKQLKTKYIKEIKNILKQNSLTYFELPEHDIFLSFSDNWDMESMIYTLGVAIDDEGELVVDSDDNIYRVYCEDMSVEFLQCLLSGLKEIL